MLGSQALRMLGGLGGVTRASGRRYALLCQLALAVLMVAAGSSAPTIAQAAPPTPASGSLVQTQPSVVRDVRAAGGNTIIAHTLTLAATGAFTGILVADERYVVHPKGVTTYQAEATFTGTVDGRAGTFVMRYAGRGDAATFPGRFVILHGTGDLATLRGQGTFALSALTGAGAYTGTFHFGP